MSPNLELRIDKKIEFEFANKSKIVEKKSILFVRLLSTLSIVYRLLQKNSLTPGRRSFLFLHLVPVLTIFFKS